MQFSGKAKGTPKRDSGISATKNFPKLAGRITVPQLRQARRTPWAKKESFLTASGAVTLLLGFEDEESG